MGDWYVPGDAALAASSLERGGFGEEGKQMFEKLRAQCKDKFTDPAFSTDKCWYTGGQADEIADFAYRPTAWRRLSEWTSDVRLFDEGISRLYQGSVRNGYLVEAMQALAMRPQLVRRLFLGYDTRKGVYLVRLFTNGVWLPVSVDDQLPISADGKPACMSCDGFPSVAWPAILEKAYAKFHHSYEAIDDGGSVVAALQDLTGGLGGEFSVREVAPDRLFVYLHELQRETLFTARVDVDACARRGTKLPDAPYAVNRVIVHEGRNFVQLCCAYLSSGPFDDVVPYSLLHHPAYPERVTQGCFWIHVEDFQSYFSVLRECRLVQGDLADSTLPHMPDPRSLAFRRPLQSTTLCCEGFVGMEKAPQFSVVVRQGHTPCEISCVLSQEDARRAHQERHAHIPMLVTVHEHVLGGAEGYAFVAKSNYAPQRDSAVVWKVVRPASFLVLVQFPVGAEVCKLVFRSYATHPVEVTAADPRKRHTRIMPLEPLTSIPLSLVGRGDTQKPEWFNSEQGIGTRRPMETSFEGGGCALQ